MKNENAIIKDAESYERTSSGLWIKKTQSIELVSTRIILQEIDNKYNEKVILLSSFKTEGK